MDPEKDVRKQKEVCNRDLKLVKRYKKGTARLKKYETRLISRHPELKDGVDGKTLHELLEDEGLKGEAVVSKMRAAIESYQSKEATKKVEEVETEEELETSVN